MLSSICYSGVFPWTLAGGMSMPGHCRRVRKAAARLSDARELSRHQHGGRRASPH